MKTLKRLCFALLLTGLVMSCVPESTGADSELYLNANLPDLSADDNGNAGTEGGGDH